MSGGARGQEFNGGLESFYGLSEAIPARRETLPERRSASLGTTLARHRSSSFSFWPFCRIRLATLTHVFIVAPSSYLSPRPQLPRPVNQNASDPQLQKPQAAARRLRRHRRHSARILQQAQGCRKCLARRKEEARNGLARLPNHPSAYVNHTPSRFVSSFLALCSRHRLAHFPYYAL